MTMKTRRTAHIREFRALSTGELSGSKENRVYGRRYTTAEARYSMTVRTLATLNSVSPMQNTDAAVMKMA